MRHEKDIDDELLTRFISGQCSADDEADVLEFLASDDDKTGDLFAIAESVALQRRADAATRRKAAARRRVWSLAASVALLIAAGGIWWMAGRQDNPDIVAMNGQDFSVIDTGCSSVPLLARNNNEMVSGNKAGNIVTENGSGIALQRMNQHYASSASAEGEPLLEVSSPRRRREVASLDDDFTFSFKNAGGRCTLVISVCDGPELLNADVTGKDGFLLTPAMRDSSDCLEWSLTLTKPDGSTIEQQGVVSFLNLE